MELSKSARESRAEVTFKTCAAGCHAVQSPAKLKDKWPKTFKGREAGKGQELPGHKSPELCPLKWTLFPKMICNTGDRPPWWQVVPAERAYEVGAWALWRASFSKENSALPSIPG